MAVTKVACLVLLCMVVVAPYPGAAITCGQVQSAVAPCINYIRKGGAVPPNCCTGIRNLNNSAKTKADRQQVCNCLKAAYNSISGINLTLASGLPGKCGVSVPYKISPSTDCSKVQ